VPSSSSEYDAWLYSTWRKFKTHILPTTLGKLKTSLKPKSLLAQYYQKKYPKTELNAVRNAVSVLFNKIPQKDQEQMVWEILSFHHVVYHETEWHKIKKNVFVCKSYEHLIDKYAKYYDVHEADVKAIICWENGGSTSSISYAGCAGLGQLSWGAVKKAHTYGEKMAEYMKAKAKACDLMYKYTGKKLYRHIADLCNIEAKFLRIENRHKKMARSFKIEDERLL